MKTRNLLLLIATHLFIGIAGFAAGIYALPILTAPPAPSAAEIKSTASQARYTGEFRRDLKDSDALHWGEGSVSISSTSIAHNGKLSPGPDYKLYLSPEFVETESDFNRLKSTMVRVGDVKTFDSFVVDLPPGINPDDFASVVVWCESFGQFITAASYK